MWMWVYLSIKLWRDSLKKQFAMFEGALWSDSTIAVSSFRSRHVVLTTAIKILPH